MPRAHPVNDEKMGRTMSGVKTSAPVEAASTAGTDTARDRILDAAETLFARDGFDATPTARITALAGVGKGLLFYYFPNKLALLRLLLIERLPDSPLCDPAEAAIPGDVSGSLLRLARLLNLGGSESRALHAIIFREGDTHPEVAAHVRSMRQGLLDLTERVLDDASPVKLSPPERRHAAQTFLAVMLDEARAQNFDATGPDLAGAAQIVANGLTHH